MSCQVCSKELEGPTCCAKCKVAYYCSRACQRKEWSQHKKECLQEQRLGLRYYSTGRPLALFEYIKGEQKISDLRKFVNIHMKWRPECVIIHTTSDYKHPLGWGHGYEDHHRIWFPDGAVLYVSIQSRCNNCMKWDREAMKLSCHHNLCSGCIAADQTCHECERSLKGAEIEKEISKFPHLSHGVFRAIVRLKERAELKAEEDLLAFQMACDEHKIEGQTSTIAATQSQRHCGGKMTVWPNAPSVVMLDFEQRYPEVLSYPLEQPEYKHTIDTILDPTQEYTDEELAQRDPKVLYLATREAGLLYTKATTEEDMKYYLHRRWLLVEAIVKKLAQ